MPDAFGLVGESPAVWELRNQVVAIARKPEHVLLLGESGSGKELVAQAVHACSSRRNRPLVSRNAATIPEGLIDAELFGNLRDYPNPGTPERVGLIGKAHQSTLFLDELAELPRNLQAHLLRVMDDGEYQRLGEATARRSELRIVAATNRAPEDIKHDLLARFAVRVSVPSLNARREDIPLLPVHLLRRQAASDSVVAERFFPNGDMQSMPFLSPVLVQYLVQHDYTANVRELNALLVRASLEAQGRYVELSLASPRTVRTRPPPASRLDGMDRLTPEESSRLALLRHHRLSPTACGRDPAYAGNRQTADLHIRQLICRLLEIADFDIAKAAKLLAGQEDGDLLRRCERRIATFLSTLRSRLAAGPESELRNALAVEWKGHVAAVLEVIDAMRNGKMLESPPSDGAANRITTVSAPERFVPSDESADRFPD